MASTQFRSDDTTLWWLKYGDGSDGDYSSSGNATDAPVDSSCSGTSGATSLSATNASFTNGKPILIHQSRGTGAGAWELNQIASYVAGTITTVSPLKNTYTDSGASQAQVIQLKQYSSYTQNSGHTLYLKAWNGNVGGIWAFLCTGDITIDGIIHGDGGRNGLSNHYGGFRGASGNTANVANRGEGTGGDRDTATTSNNGNGGGGGRRQSSPGGLASGGGGGNATAGGTGAGETPPGGVGGTSAGNQALTNIVFGGGGGGGGGVVDAGNPEGVGGGGIAIIIGGSLTVNNSTGYIRLRGAQDGTGARAGCGGGGGGSFLAKLKLPSSLGTNRILCSAPDLYSLGGATNYPISNGSQGRIHLDYLTSYTGTTTPTLDATQDYSLSASRGNMLLAF